MSDAHTAPQWLARRERGSATLLRFMVWVTLRLGRPAARMMLPVIVLYFAVFSPRARRASRDYLARILERPARFGDMFRHYLAFATTIMDRVYFLSGRYHYFDIVLHGEQDLRAAIGAGRGCLLLGAHLGSFEALRASGGHHIDRPVSMLMDTTNARMVMSVFTELDPTLAQSIISMGEPSSLIRARERLEAGGLVGTLGDRLRPGDDAVECDFLGRRMRLPAGPLTLAGLLNVPVLLGVALYRGGRRYDIHIEMLAESIELPRNGRAQAVAALMQRYAGRLEHYCKVAPYNWFNFYDVWDRNA